MPHAATATAAPYQPDPPGRSPLALLSGIRVYVDIALVVAVLVTTNLIAHFTGSLAAVITVPIAGVALIVLARRRGLGWQELGLAREHWRSGAKYALAAIGVVGTVIAVGAALPITRGLFLNDRYATFSAALIASMVLIPLQTAIPEELAFRGALHGTLQRAMRLRWVAATGSLLFGFWHIATSLGLTAGNAGLTAILGHSIWAQVAGIGGAVLATAAAGFVFTWLRSRSGSLLAPIALHWCLNGAGALAAAIAWNMLR